MNDLLNLLKWTSETHTNGEVHEHNHDAEALFGDSALIDHINALHQLRQQVENSVQ